MVFNPPGLVSENKIRALILLIVIYAILFMYHLTFEANTYFLHDYKQELLGLKKIDHLLIGSSLVKDVLPEGISAGSYSVHRTYADIVDVQLMLEDVLSIVAVSGRIYMPVDLLFFQRRREKNCFEKIAIEGISWKGFGESGLAGCLIEPLTAPKSYIKYRVKQGLGMTGAFVRGREPYGRPHSGKWVKTLQNVSSQAGSVPLESDFSMAENQRNYYEQNWKKLLDTMGRHNLQLVLFTPPFHRHHILDVRARTDFNHREKMIQHAVDRGAEYHEFSQLFIENAKSRLFFDDRHLNDQGAARFTKILKQATDRRIERQSW